MSDQAAPDSIAIDRETPGLDQRYRCEVCEEPLAWHDVTLTARRADEVIDSWSICDVCYRLLRETILVEIIHGPGTPPPEAWTRVRKLRAARRRRWGKADP